MTDFDWAGGANYFHEGGDLDVVLPQIDGFFDFGSDVIHQSGDFLTGFDDVRE